MRILIVIDLHHHNCEPFLDYNYLELQQLVFIINFVFYELFFTSILIENYHMYCEEDHMPAR